MHRRTFLLTMAAVPIVIHGSAKAGPTPVHIADTTGQWQSGPKPLHRIIIVDDIDENGKFAGPLSRIVDAHYKDFHPPFKCLITFEFRRADRSPWLPLNPPDDITSPAGLIFESRRFDLIDRAADFHHSIWRKHHNIRQTDLKLWNQENQARRAHLNHIVMTFDTP